MTVGTSIFLIAVGAILKFAVHAHVSGLSLQTVGIILMVAGVIGLILSFFWLTAWRDRRRRDVVVDDRPVVDERPYARY
jgi:Na+/melibiose symporter-like transporter